MPALSHHHDGTGGGDDFRANEGKQPAILAEVVDTGMRSDPNYPNKKAKPTCKGIFILPEDLIGMDAPDRLGGQPKLIYLFINNNKFTNLEDPDYRTAYEKMLASWAGRSIPIARQNGFYFGRELGTGKDEWGFEKWDPSLKGDAMKAQRLAKPGIPVGSQVLMYVVHTTKDKKTYANPGPCSVLSMDKWIEKNGGGGREYAAFCSTWMPGLNKADENARRYTLNEKGELFCDGKPYPEGKPYTYRTDAQREADKAARVGSGGGGSWQGQSSQNSAAEQQVFDEPEDDIPF